MRTISLALLAAGCALSFQATSGWIPDSQHPSVQYRFKCTREALSIDWRSSYPGAVSLKARVRGSNYDGDEQVVIPPGGTVTSSLETLYCTPESFQVTEKRFSMAAPPPPVIASTKPGEPAKPAPPPPPTVTAWTPPAPLTEVPAGAFCFHSRWDETTGIARQDRNSAFQTGDSGGKRTSRALSVPGVRPVRWRSLTSPMEWLPKLGRLNRKAAQDRPLRDTTSPTNVPAISATATAFQGCLRTLRLS